MAITDWPEAERPREKLLKGGPASLSDAELLAIFLRVGVTGKSAVDLARELLNHFGSLHALFGATETELSRIKGMGSAKYVQLQATLEMARRALIEELKRPEAFANPQSVARFLKLSLGKEKREHFEVLFLDQQHRLIQSERLFSGSLSETSVHPRVVATRAIQLHAAAVIVAHNHPSGCPEPSSADIAITHKLKVALELLEIRLLDHFIVGDTITSMAERGLLT